MAENSNNREVDQDNDVEMTISQIAPNDDQNNDVQMEGDFALLQSSSAAPLNVPPSIPNFLMINEFIAVTESLKDIRIVNIDTTSWNFQHQMLARQCVLLYNNNQEMNAMAKSV